MFNSPRLKKELSQLIGKPPIGIKVNVKEDSSYILEAGKSFSQKKFFLIIILFRAYNNLSYNDLYMAFILLTKMYILLHYETVLIFFRTTWTERFSL